MQDSQTYREFSAGGREQPGPAGSHPGAVIPNKE